MFRKTHGDDPTKVLFLDIDGVLNSQQFFENNKFRKREQVKRGKHNARDWDLKKIKLLAEIHNKTKCTVVMSSSWRHFWFQKEKDCLKKWVHIFKRDLKKEGIVIRYKTSNVWDKKLWHEYNGDLWIENEDGTYSTKPNPNFDRTKRVITQFYERGLQIKTWLKSHPEVRNFAVLDDDDGDLHLFGEHYIQTKYWGDSEEESGLTKACVSRCIKILNREEPK